MNKKQGQDIKEIRAFLGLTQREFAEKYHIPLGTLRYWEQGRQMPTYVKNLLWLIAYHKQAQEDIPVYREEIKRLTIENKKLKKEIEKLKSQ